MVRVTSLGKKHLSKDWKEMRRIICMTSHRRSVLGRGTPRAGACMWEHAWLAQVNQKSRVSNENIGVTHVRMYRGGQVAYSVETHGSSLVSTLAFTLCGIWNHWRLLSRGVT